MVRPIFYHSLVKRLIFHKIVHISELFSPSDSIANSTQTKQIDSLKRVVKSLEVNHSLSIRHYNRVLEISLKNPKRFNVSQFIDKLQQDGVKINE